MPKYPILLLLSVVFIMFLPVFTSPLSSSRQALEKYIDERTNMEPTSQASSDLYGIGVRIGIYLQSIGGTVSLFVEGGKGYKIAISANSIGILTAWTILMERELLTFSEAYLVLIEIGCVLIPGVIVLMDPQTAANELVGLVGLILALTWMVAGGIWLFTTHHTQLPSNGAPDLGWIFARVQLNGWFRIFMIVIYSIFSFGLLLIIIYVFGLIIFVLRHHDDEDEVQEALKEYENKNRKIITKGRFHTWRYLSCCLGIIVWTFAVVSCEKTIILNGLHPENSFTSPSQTIPLAIGIIIASDGFSAFRKAMFLKWRKWRAQEERPARRYPGRTMKNSFHQAY